MTLMSEDQLRPSRPFSPEETAHYTKEMLESLRRIALEQRQELLAHLLELAVVEAQIQEDHDTLLAG